MVAIPGQYLATDEVFDPHSYASVSSKFSVIGKALSRSKNASQCSSSKQVMP